MKRFPLSCFAFLLMASLVGCGSSSMDLPESAITEDCYAIQWTDTKSLTPDMAKDMIRGIADDMSDDQPQARLQMSAQADMVEARYEERWDAFTEAGGLGFLQLHYVLKKKADGDDEDAEPTFHYRTYVLIRVKKSAKADEIEEAIQEYAEEDNSLGNAEDKDVKLVKVEGEDEWYWLTTEARPDGFKLPEDEDEDSVKAFNKLIGSTNGAPAFMVWRRHDKLIESYEKTLDDDEIDHTDDEKARLNEIIHLESLVMAVTAGSSPEIIVTVNFDDKEYAKTFAEEHNDGLVRRRAGLKMMLMKAENPPHPSVIDRLVDQMDVKASGSSVSITMNSRTVKDGITIEASVIEGNAPDTTSPGTIFMAVSSAEWRQLKIPGMPGPASAFGISFHDPSGRDR